MRWFRYVAERDRWAEEIQLLRAELPDCQVQRVVWIVSLVLAVSTTWSCRIKQGAKQRVENKVDPARRVQAPSFSALPHVVRVCRKTPKTPRHAGVRSILLLDVLHISLHLDKPISIILSLMKWWPWKYIVYLEDF